jgi:hypothetical protein
VREAALEIEKISVLTKHEARVMKLVKERLVRRDCTILA